MKDKQTTYEDFTQLKDFLTNYAFSLLRSRQDAEDVVQDMYLKLLTRQEGVGDIREPKAYCIRILKNMCLDRLRSEQKDADVEIAENLEDNVSLSEKIESKDQLDAVVEAIGSLPAGQRTVITQRAINDLSYEEISQRTGMNSQTMRTQLSMARRTLRRRFAWGVAVSAAVALFVFLAVPKTPTDSFSDPRLAYAELEKRFDYIATKMNKSTEIARKAEPAIQKVDRIMNNKNYK